MIPQLSQPYSHFVTKNLIVAQSVKTLGSNFNPYVMWIPRVFNPSNVNKLYTEIEFTAQSQVAGLVPRSFNPSITSIIQKSAH